MNRLNRIKDFWTIRDEIEDICDVTSTDARMMCDDDSIFPGYLDEKFEAIKERIEQLEIIFSEFVGDVRDDD